MFSWDAPQVLWLLVLLAPMAFGLLTLVGRLRARQARFADPDLLEQMKVRVPEAREALRVTLLVGAFALVAIAAAGPRVGGRLGARLPGEAPSLVVAFDVSKSMGCQDVSPSRMDVARDGVVTLMDDMTQWRAGLVAFADESLVFCPMTSDLSAVKTLSARLKPGMRELKQGSNLPMAIHTALAQLHGRPGAILVASDGESLSGDVAAARAEASKAGVPVYALMVGTPEGARIPDGTDLFGQPTFRTGADGSPIMSHADPRALEDLAKGTGGLALNGAESGAPERLLAAMRTRFGADGVSEEGTSLYGVPLTLALILLLLEVLLESSWRLNFRTRLGLEGVVQRLKPMAGLLVALLALSQMAWTWPWAGYQHVQAAAKAYGTGNFQGASASLKQALTVRPGDPKVLYDLGCARYQANDFKGAASAFTQALDHAPAGSKTEAWLRYNLGNSLFRLGEATRDRRQQWTQAIAQYKEAVRLDPKDADARYNLDLVTKLLKQLPPDKPQGGQGAQQQAPAQQGGGTPVPNEAEVQATLDALQHEEQRHQAEVNEQNDQTPPPSSPSDMLKQLVNQAANPNTGSDKPDW